MLATAPAPSAITAPVPPTGLDRALPRSVRVEGRICTVPTLSYTATGVAVAHFLLDCDELHDPRLRVLAHGGSTVIDVTVWGADAVFVADPGSASHTRFRVVAEALQAINRLDLPDDEKAAAKLQAMAWDITQPMTLPIRSGVRVSVDGTPRRGCWHPIGYHGELPLGLIADGLPRPLRRDCRA